ncbi:MAG: hypothetical protein LWW85_06830 [Marinilabiliales bacterium]|nr:hypothetical protein [Marinilabiliales bacterium]
MKERLFCFKWAWAFCLLSAIECSYGAFSCTASGDESAEKRVIFHFKPKLGLTYSGNKENGSWVNNLQWMVTLNSDLNYRRPGFDLGSSLFVQYGESRVTGQSTQKLKDVVILSITPSIPILKSPSIRLFLETTGETAMTDGTLQNKPTGLLKPLFLYQSLFLGQKHYSNQDNEKTTWGLTYGVGYALQQTLNNPYDIIHTKNDFESGFSGIADFTLNSQLSKSVSLSFSAKLVALSKENPLRDFDNYRRSLLLQAGLFYKKIGFELNYHAVHDLNLSPENMVDRSLMLTIRF